MESTLIIILVILVIFIIIIAAVAISNNSDPQNTTNEQVCLSTVIDPSKFSEVTLAATCPTGTTCRNSGGQTYFTDPRCLNPSTDKYGGLGCNAIANDPESRFCCFGPYSLIPCPGLSTCPTGPSSNCDACPYPNVCEISSTNPQTFNYDPTCITNGGGKGCNWDNDLACRLCGPPNYTDVPCLYGPHTCTNNSQCTGGFICQNGTCVTGTCINSSDCTGGYVCSNGNCVSGHCQTDNQCPTGFQCQDNQCTKICCDNNAQCSSDRICADKVCRRITPKTVKLTFKNESGSTILLGANGPTPVMPIEGTWVLPSGGELNINVPPDWTQTAQAAQCNSGVVGPRFWARTGCEVGNPYWATVIPNVRDIVPAIIVGPDDPPANSNAGNGIDPNTYIVGTKYVNMTTGAIFYKSYGSKWVKLNQTLYVNVASPNPNAGKLGDIYFQPTTSSSTGNWFMKHQKAQCMSGNCGDSYDCSYNNFSDRAPTSLTEFCFDCGLGFHYYDVSLVDGYNLSINITPVGGSATNPLNPNDPFWNQTGLCINNIDLRSRNEDKFSLNAATLPESIPPSNYVVGVFSNCGYYEYPTAPAADCDPTTDERCKYWRSFCCQSNSYGKTCGSDADCDAGGACWNGKCQCRAYYKCQDTGPTPPSNQQSIVNGQWIPRCCNQNICFENRDPAAQPISGGCNTADNICIGDDNVHDICPKAYSWPNDPTTFDTNATSFIITFSPGGTNYGNIPNPTNVPLCSSLDPKYYNYSSQVGVTGYCSVPISNGAIYTCAEKNSNTPWPCNVDNPGASCQGIGTLCRWK
jgi:hypothetical protein